jgi:hypothetical protein
MTALTFMDGFLNAEGQPAAQLAASEVVKAGR